MQTYDSSFINGHSYFANDRTQNYLVFQPLIKHFEVSKTIDIIVVSQKSKGLSNKIFKPPTTINNNLNSKLNYLNVPKFK